MLNQKFYDQVNQSLQILQLLGDLTALKFIDFHLKLIDLLST